MNMTQTATPTQDEAVKVVHETPTQPQFLTLEEAAKVVPGQPSKVSLWRWCRKGYQGTKLEYLKAGRRIVITPAALEVFMKALSANDRPLPTPPAPDPSPTMVPCCNGGGR